MRKSLTRFSASFALFFALFFSFSAPLHLHVASDGIKKECPLCLAAGSSSKAITRTAAIFTALVFVALLTITDFDLQRPLFSIGSLIRGPPPLP
jgi:hypothetical protein